MSEIATAPDGVIHVLTPDGNTVCGLNASGWSRTITTIQLLGLVLHCQVCYA